WMSSTLGDFLVNEVVYLPSVTEEAPPRTQRPKILPEHRKEKDAYTEWITQSIEHRSRNLLELLGTGALIQTENRPQDNSHGNLLHSLPHGKGCPTTCSFITSSVMS